MVKFQSSSLQAGNHKILSFKNPQKLIYFVYILYHKIIKIPQINVSKDALNHFCIHSSAQYRLKTCCFPNSTLCSTGQ